jgi:hypothetical protein
MDAYRPGPNEHFRPTASSRPGDASSTTPAAAAEAARAAALSPAEAALLARPFMPIVSAEWPQYAVASDALHAAAEAAGGLDALLTSDGRGPDEPLWVIGDDDDDYYRGRRQLSSSMASPPGSRGFSKQPRPGSAPVFKSTIAKPFGFEARAAGRPAGIAAVKADQDRELRWMEEAALRRAR